MLKKKNKTAVNPVISVKEDSNIFKLNSKKEDLPGEIPEPAKYDASLPVLRSRQEYLTQELANIKEKEIPEALEGIKEQEEKVRGLQKKLELEEIEPGVLSAAEDELGGQKEALKFLEEGIVSKEGALVKVKNQIDERLKLVGQVPEPAEYDAKVLELRSRQEYLAKELASIKEKEIPEALDSIKKQEEKVRGLREDLELEQLEPGVLSEAEDELEEQKETLKFLEEGIVSKEGALVKVKNQINERLKLIRSQRADHLQKLIDDTRELSRAEINKGLDALNKLAELESQRMEDVVRSGQQTAFPVLDSFLKDKYPLLISLCEFIRDGLNREKIEPLLNKLSKELSGPVRGF